MFYSNYTRLLTQIENSSYTAKVNCIIYVEIVTNSIVFGYSIVKIGDRYCRYYQNSGNQENLTDGTVVYFYLKKGDTISVIGNGVKRYKYYVYGK